MAKNPYDAYLKRVKRKLCCSGADKRRLLAGLEAEAAEVFPEGSVPSAAQMRDRFGDPEALARELEAALEPEELERARKRRRLLMWLGLAVCAVVIVLLAYHLIWIGMHDIKYINTEIIYLNIKERSFP